MNYIKNIFQNMSSWSQLLFLFLFVLIGLVIGSFATAFVALIYTWGTGDIAQSVFLAMKSPNFIRLAQFIQQIFMFVIPAVLCAYFFNKQAAGYLKIKKAPDFKFTVLSILLVLVVQPIISFTGYYNSKLKLPEALSGLEAKMQAYEASARAIMEQMLAGDSISILIVNLFIIAIMAGISEEFIFRGALQQIFNRITRNYHWAVWISAFIFSAIHFQFYGFVPRLILGALLGYVFVWSGNLWIPIIVHAVNNTLSVLIYKAYYNTPNYDKVENIGVGDMWWTTCMSVILTGVIVIYMYKEYIRKQFENDDY